MGYRISIQENKMDRNKIKLALIGGQDIKKYTIADILWAEIARLGKVNMEFEIIPINMSEDLYKFYWEFIEDQHFIGFNVALPWKMNLAEMVDNLDEFSSKVRSVNTIFKSGNDISACNTDVIGIETPLIKRTNLNGKKILILGFGGAGLPTAVYLSEKHSCDIFVFDNRDKTVQTDGVTFINTYDEINARKYDVIINATPVGKFYLNQFPEGFSSPISVKTFREICHEETIVQEMNYLPDKTELLLMAEEKGLKVISGIEMLVYQALNSFKRYVGIEFDQSKIDSLISFVTDISKQKEKQIYERRTTNIR